MYCLCFARCLHFTRYHILKFQYTTLNRNSDKRSNTSNRQQESVGDYCCWSVSLVMLGVDTGFDENTYLWGLCMGGTLHVDNCVTVVLCGSGNGWKLKLYVVLKRRVVPIMTSRIWCRGENGSVHRNRVLGGTSPVRGVDVSSAGCLTCNIVLSFMGRVEFSCHCSLFQLVMSWDFLCFTWSCGYVRVLGEVRLACIWKY
jgi:hypothetical protein